MSDTKTLYSEIQKNYQEGKLGKSLVQLDQLIFTQRWTPELRQLQKKIEKEVKIGLGKKTSTFSDFSYQLSSYIRPYEFYFFGALSLILFLIFKELKKLKKPFQWSLLTMSFGCFLFGTITHFTKDISILAQEANLYSLPLKSTDPIRTLPEGTRFSILKKKKNFLEIERENSFKGWIEIKEANKNEKSLEAL